MKAAVRLWPQPKWDFDFWQTKLVVAPQPAGTLLRRIQWAAYHEGFVGLIVTGPPGVGKSLFGLKVMRAIYGDWNTALNMVVFKWEEVKERLLDAALNRYRFVVIEWDDMAIFARRYLYRTGPKRAEEMAALVQLIRTQLACHIGTAPMLEDIASFLRERTGYIHVMLEPAPTALKKKYGRRHLVKAAFAEFREKPFGIEKRISARALIDVEVPDHIYTRYYEKRRRYILELREELLREEGGEEEE
jgi:DNA polymerase III delta prime subunit